MKRIGCELMCSASVIPHYEDVKLAAADARLQPRDCCWRAVAFSAGGDGVQIKEGARRPRRAKIGAARSTRPTDSWRRNKESTARCEWGRSRANRRSPRPARHASLLADRARNLPRARCGPPEDASPALADGVIRRGTNRLAAALACYCSTARRSTKRAAKLVSDDVAYFALV